MRLVIPAALALAILAGCVTAERIAAIEDRLVEEWAAANPGVDITPEIRAEIHKQAVILAEEEAAREREDAVKHGAGAFAGFSSGNVIAGILGLIGLGGVGYGSYRRMKGKAVKA